MRKLILFATVVLGWLMASSMAHALTVTLNGVPYTVDTFTITQGPGGATIETSPAIVPGDNTGEPSTPPGEENPSPPPPPPPPPPEDNGSCVQSDTQRCGTINWASPGGRLTSSLPGTSMTQSWQFTTTSNPLFSGDINVAETTGYEGVTRRIWISTTPGGAALANSRCSSEGNSNRKIAWGQSAMFLRCPLQTNTTYFLNIKNVSGCASAANCGFYRNTSTNGSP